MPRQALACGVDRVCRARYAVPNWRSVAVAMAGGPAVGLPLVTTLLQNDALQNYRLAHAVQADLFRDWVASQKPWMPTSAPWRSRNRGRRSGICSAKWLLSNLI